MKVVTVGDGHEKLWLWFGLSRASFLVLPRVLMHEMPDEWQRRMADLLNEYDETFPFGKQPPIGTTVRAADLNGRLIPMPEWAVEYRHPMRHEIEKLKKRGDHD